MVTYKFDADGVSRAGAVKETNEDRLAILRHDRDAFSVLLAAVADGVGGLDDGALASQMVVSALNARWNKIAWPKAPPIETVMEEMLECVEDVNEDILRWARGRGKQIGTTLSLLLLKEDAYRFLSIGDSRIYKVDKGVFSGISQLSEDHVAMMPKTVGGKTVMKPYLAEFIGKGSGMKCHMGGGRHAAKDAFVVCSDGVYRTLKPEQIRRIVRRYPRRPGKAAQDLAMKAEMNNEKDNLTAAVVYIVD